MTEQQKWEWIKSRTEAPIERMEPKSCIGRWIVIACALMAVCAVTWGL